MGISQAGAQGAGLDDTTGYRLSVIIPAYNEEKGIASILERVLVIRSHLITIGVAGFEVIVVDDGSQDRTAEIACSFPEVKLICHVRNRGYGAALKTGFLNATGNLLAFLDADGTYPPEHFPELCSEVISGADLVIGSRMTGTPSEMPRTRRLGNQIFANMVTLLGNHHVSDSASGMRVLKREVLERLYPLPDGLNFTPVMSIRAIHEGIKMAEVPIPYHERLGHSKLNVVQDGMRFFNSIVWTVLSYNPVRILGLAGLAGAGVAALIAAMLVVVRLSGVTQVAPWDVFGVVAALVSGVIGVSLFCLGAVLNHLVTLFHKRPIQRGLLAKPIFDPPLDRQFWWMGGLLILAGLAVGLTSLALSFGGWDLNRLWLWLLASAMAVLIGVQLVVTWIVMRLAEELCQREIKTELDLVGKR